MNDPLKKIVKEYGPRALRVIANESDEVKHDSSRDWLLKCADLIEELVAENDKLVKDRNELNVLIEEYEKHIPRNRLFVDIP